MEVDRCIAYSYCANL